MDGHGAAGSRRPPTSVAHNPTAAQRTWGVGRARIRQPERLGHSPVQRAPALRLSGAVARQDARVQW
ncbi:hypothetical protein SCATT_30990 [Streptantibioticus cattleyicolor NRRL 8057 = DSM 46488]|uniref:Uncharacterized protein n=1 Tax=Streptantibioticus cattleyicolor (strain ATCC 35852 / DSM 46488 / JCM 4925 / NBRC 14057 / NRRL 8057) TaxID=1003195 RepID=G8WWV6_STREN|nr:hypothetical protein SCATT_30990 [Streptantibioticus cattleyicolor NRRL 8057 = DSM 46488]